MNEYPWLRASGLPQLTVMLLLLLLLLLLRFLLSLCLCLSLSSFVLVGVGECVSVRHACHSIPNKVNARTHCSTTPKMYDLHYMKKKITLSSCSPRSGSSASHLIFYASLKRYYRYLYTSSLILPSIK